MKLCPGMQVTGVAEDEIMRMLIFIPGNEQAISKMLTRSKNPHDDGPRNEVAVKKVHALQVLAMGASH